MTERASWLDRCWPRSLRRTKHISATQHELARQQRILARAATELRSGKGGQVVLAEIREQDEDLMRDHGDLQVTLAPSPLRTVARATASA